MILTLISEPKMQLVLLASSAYTLLFALHAPRAALHAALGAVPATLLGVSIKVLPALLLSALARAAPHPAAPLYPSRVSLALLLSALGDALLDLCELPGLKDACFLLGLGSFLLAHLAYCAAFLATTATRAHSLATAIACASMPCAVVALLRPHILASPAHAPLFPAVCVYVAAITAMLYLSVARTPSGGARNWWLTVAGAALFMLSDAVLAWDRFAPPPRGGDGRVRWWWAEPKLIVMVTYFGAQALLARATVPRKRAAGAAVKAD